LTTVQQLIHDPQERSRMQQAAMERALIFDLAFRAHWQKILLGA